MGKSVKPDLFPLKKAPIRKLMKDAGAKLVAENALTQMSLIARQMVEDCTDFSLQMNNVYGKKKITKKVLDFAYQKQCLPE